MAILFFYFQLAVIFVIVMYAVKRYKTNMEKTKQAPGSNKPRRVPPAQRKNLKKVPPNLNRPRQTREQAPHEYRFDFDDATRDDQYLSEKFDYMPTPDKPVFSDPSWIKEEETWVRDDHADNF